MSATQPKPANPPALRLAIVLSGTVVAEQIVRDHRPFSLGQGARATVQLALPSLPRCWELLTLTATGLRLRLAPGMDARVSVGDEVWTRAVCDARGTVANGVTTVTLPFDAHGRLELGAPGELRVLFQGVRLPARAAVPALPRALRGSLADRIDSRIAVLAAASLVVHMGLMVAASLNDPPGESTMAERATEQYRDDTVAIIDATDPIFDLTPPTTEPATSTNPTTPNPEPTATPPSTPSTKPPSTPSTKPPGTPDAPARIDDPTGDATRLADLLFANDGDRGTLLGDLAARKPGTDLAQQLDEVRDGNQTATIGDQTGRVRPDGTPQIGTVQEPGTPTKDPGIDKIDKGDELVPPGRIKPVPGPNPPDGLPVDAIIKKISTTYMGGLQRCYKKSLAGDGTLAGKVSLTFTVTDRGALTDGNASGVENELAGCIEGLMAKWTFTPVKDADGDAADVDVKLGLALTPH